MLAGPRMTFVEEGVQEWGYSGNGTYIQSSNSELSPAPVGGPNLRDVRLTWPPSLTPGKTRVTESGMLLFHALNYKRTERHLRHQLTPDHDLTESGKMSIFFRHYNGVAGIEL